MNILQKSLKMQRKDLQISNSIKGHKCMFTILKLWDKKSEVIYKANIWAKWHIVSLDIFICFAWVSEEFINNYWLWKDHKFDADLAINQCCIIVKSSFQRETTPLSPQLYYSHFH